MVFPLILALAGLLDWSASPAAVPSSDRSGEQELSRLLAGHQAGKPIDCISPPDMDRVQVVGRTAIVYGRGNHLYVNRPSTGAGALRDDDVLVTSISGGQLCRIDTVQLLDRDAGMVRGFVVLGSFVPYDRPR